VVVVAAGPVAGAGGAVVVVVVVPVDWTASLYCIWDSTTTRVGRGGGGGRGQLAVLSSVVTVTTAS
jgi:hypothetical protein